VKNPCNVKNEMYIHFSIPAFFIFVLKSFAKVLLIYYKIEVFCPFIFQTPFKLTKICMYVRNFSSM
jgi:hypothetical protein